MRKLLAVSLLFVGCASAQKATYEPEADREGVRNVVRDHLKELRQCYYQTLESNPAAEGKIVLAWDLDRGGKATNTKVDSVTGRRGIEAIGPCLVDRVNSWQFPPPNSNEVVSIKYPLYFSENGKQKFDEAPAKAKPDLGEFAPLPEAKPSNEKPMKAEPANDF